MRALVDAGAVKRIRIIADGARFHVEAVTANGPVTASTLKGSVKTWPGGRWMLRLGGYVHSEWGPPGLKWTDGGQGNATWVSSLSCEGPAWSPG